MITNRTREKLAFGKLNSKMYKQLSEYINELFLYDDSDESEEIKNSNDEVYKKALEFLEAIQNNNGIKVEEEAKRIENRLEELRKEMLELEVKIAEYKAVGDSESISKAALLETAKYELSLIEKKNQREINSIQVFQYCPTKYRRCSILRNIQKGEY